MSKTWEESLNRNLIFPRWFIDILGDVSNSLSCTSWPCGWKVSVYREASWRSGYIPSKQWYGFEPRVTSFTLTRTFQGYPTGETQGRHGSPGTLHKHIQLQCVTTPELCRMPIRFQISSSRCFIHEKVDIKNVCFLEPNSCLLITFSSKRDWDPWRNGRF